MFAVNDALRLAPFLLDTKQPPHFGTTTFQQMCGLSKTKAPGTRHANDRVCHKIIEGRSRVLAANLLFLALAGFNTVRVFRHAMWRDELQAFMLAAASSTPLELFAKLKYEGHPALWHLILWLITRLTSDPVWMQVAHLVIALGIWLLIWFRSPFGLLDKILLILSYYLFWEYFIVGRSYALGVLLGFGFIALWSRRPEQRFWPWVLLGLLANTSVFGTIWSCGLAALFAYDNRREWQTHLPGLVAYALLTALAVATMIPTPDSSYANEASFVLEGRGTGYVIGSFVPLFSPFVKATFSSMGWWGRSLLEVIGRDPANQIALWVQESSLLTALVLSLPVLICWSTARSRLLTIFYASTVIGVVLFADLLRFDGGPRHHGILFIALIGSVWLANRTGKMLASRLLTALLVINAAGGLTTLSSEFQPFSQSRNAAQWIEENHLEDELLIGSPAAASAVAGYLQRPLFYPECECFGTYVEWKRSRKSGLSVEELVERLDRILVREQKDQAVLILNTSFDFEQKAPSKILAFERLTQFRNAMLKSENFFIYRVTRGRSN